MSVYLAGLADDPLTDAFLNPARVETAAARPTLHVAVMPDRTAQWSYPTVPGMQETSDGMPQVTTYRPYTVGLFGPVGGAYATATVEVGLDDDESLRQDWDMNTYTSTIYTYEGLRASSNDRLHLLADAAAAWDGGGGIRLTVARDRVRPGSVDASTRTNIYPAAGGEVEEDYRFSRQTGDRDALDAGLSGGFFRSGEHDLAQGVLGLAFVRRQSDLSVLSTWIQDEDVDGNGLDPWGGTPFYSVSRSEQVTTRDYAGGRILGRLLGYLGEKMRYRVEAAAEYTTGDGDARYTSIESETETTVTRTTTATDYTYDGREKRYDVVASLGFAEQVLPDVLAAAGVYAAWHRVDFAEDGVGEATYASDVDGTGVEETTPYFQRALLLDDAFRLVAPVALEWRPVAPLAIRGGVEITAVRFEHDASVRQRVDSPTLPSTLLEARDARSSVDSSVFARFNFGIGLALGERLFLDLGRFQQETVDLAAYTQVSALVRF